MNEAAFLLLGAAALAVHLVATVLAAPLLAGQDGGAMRPAMALARVSWRTLLLQPFQDLHALAAKEPVRSDGVSALSVAAPPVSLALTLAAAVLVPSFATGMLDSPLADLLLVLGLLAAARVVWLLAAVDEGLAASGLSAVGGLVDGLLAAPGAVLAVSVLALAAGTGLDAVLAAQHAAATPGGLACAGALALAALSAGGRGRSLSQSLSGPDLALFRLQGGLQRLVWIDLVGALAWPGSLAPAQSEPLRWLLALLCWGVRLGIGALLLRAVAGRVGSVETRRALAGLSLLAALLAPILLLAGQGTP